MKHRDANAVGMTFKDLLWPREVGEPVVSHVLENAKEPAPDFDAMKRALSDAPAVPSPPRDDAK